MWSDEKPEAMHARIRDDMAERQSRAWESIDHLARFETIADLYYRRFRRLYPGKSEPMVSGRDSSSDENRFRAKAWKASGLAWLDAIMALASARAHSAVLEERLMDADMALADAKAHSAVLEERLTDADSVIQDKDQQIESLERQLEKAVQSREEIWNRLCDTEETR